MPTASAPFRPDWISPPGDTLADLLEERSMTQTELAERLGVSLKHVNRVTKGAASISAELALGLEKVFGAPAAFWMTREAHFRANEARLEQRQEFSADLDWAKSFPVTELRKRGLIPSHGNGADLVEQLLRFFGVAHPAQWKEPQVAYRKSQKFESDCYALSAWLREGELEAAEIPSQPYDENRFLEVLRSARSLTALDPQQWWPALQQRCAEAGVLVTIINAYTGVKANGATRWLSQDKALIQLSLRHKWEDVFWFTFFHEAGHVVLHRKKDLFIEVDKKDLADNPEALQAEAEADRFAARTLIPPPYARRLRALDLSEVVSFAESLDIAPAIVVGRMHHDKLLAYNKGNNFRRRLQLT